MARPLAGALLQRGSRALSTAPRVPTLPAFDHVPHPYQGPSPEVVLSQRQRFLSPGGHA